MQVFYFYETTQCSLQLQTVCTTITTYNLPSKKDILKIPVLFALRCPQVSTSPRNVLLRSHFDSDRLCGNIPFWQRVFFCLHWASSYYVLQNGKKRNWNCMNVIEALCNLNKTWMNGIERERRAWILNSLKFDPVLPLSEIQLGKIVLWTTLPYWKRICRTANVAWTIQKRDERSANCLPL